MVWLIFLYNDGELIRCNNKNIKTKTPSLQYFPFCPLPVNQFVKTDKVKLYEYVCIKCKCYTEYKIYPGVGDLLVWKEKL